MTFLHAFLILLALMLVIGAGLFAAFVIACYTDEEPRSLPGALGTPLDAVDALEEMRAKRDASTVYPDVALFAADVRRDIRALPDLWDVAP